MANLGIVAGSCVCWGIIYGSIWGYKFARDKNIVQQAQLEPQRKPALLPAPPMASPGSRRLFVPSPLQKHHR
jgi:hypothetical protein